MQRLPEEVKGKTPCLSLRLRLRPSGAKAHHTPRRNSNTTRIPFELLRVHSRHTPSEPRISSKNTRILLEYSRIDPRTFLWTTISADSSMTCPANPSAPNSNLTASSSANSGASDTPTRKSPASLAPISASASLPAPSTISSRSDPSSAHRSAFLHSRPLNRVRRLPPTRRWRHRRRQPRGTAGSTSPPAPLCSVPYACSSVFSARPINQELTMDQKIRQLVNQLPPKPFRSKL